MFLDGVKKKIHSGEVYVSHEQELVDEQAHSRYLIYRRITNSCISFMGLPLHTAAFNGGLS